MCTELILAIIYFLTLVIINYFMFKLIKTNLINIFNLIKIEKILKYSYTSEKKNLFYYLIQLQKNSKNSKVLSELNKVLESKDLLLIGNTYQFLSKKIALNFQVTQKKEFVSNKIYLNLLENQYLSKDSFK